MLVKKSIKANIRRENIYTPKANMLASYNKHAHPHTYTTTTAVARSHVLSINFSEEKFLSKQNQQISAVIKNFKERKKRTHTPPHK